MNCKVLVITTIALVGTSILSQNYHFLFVVRTFHIYSLKFKCHSLLNVPVTFSVVTACYKVPMPPLE